jgi:hypothetical protein
VLALRSDAAGEGDEAAMVTIISTSSTSASHRHTRERR